MKKYILVFDSGTTSIKALVYNKSLDLLGSVVKKIASHSPGPRIV